MTAYIGFPDENKICVIQPYEIAQIPFNGKSKYKMI